MSNHNGQVTNKEGKEHRVPFPFSAIVDQELLKLALILNTINPSIGGLLVKGEKGSGKSTAVRALSSLLPMMDVVKDCPYSCAPDDPTSMCDICKESIPKNGELSKEKKDMRVVTLPLGATEDRVIGSINIQKALGEGLKAFQHGILAEANRNVLYIDEINLLPDHLVDDILDAAASGWNVVEREGISITHPSKFLLIGTMNPEEGELRPQLLDRLPLSVSIGSIRNASRRVEVVKRNLEFSEDPIGFREKFVKEDNEIKNRIIKARSILSKVTVPEQIFHAAAELAIRLKVDGHRPDIVMIQVAKALAAYEGRFQEEHSDLEIAAKLTLGHRTRSGGYEAPVTSTELTKFLKESIDVSKKVPNNKSGSDDKSGNYTMKGSDNIPYWKSEAKGAQATDRTSRFQSLRGPLPFKRLRLSPSRVKGSFLEKDRAAEPQDSDGSGKGGLLKSFWRKTRSGSELTVRDDEGGTRVLIGFSQSGGTFEEGEALFRIEDSILDKKTSFSPITHFRSKERRAEEELRISGRRIPFISTGERGRVIGYDHPKGRSRDFSLLGTLLKSLLHVSQKGSLKIVDEDLMVNLRMSRAPFTMMMVLDLSESMMVHMNKIKNAITALHLKAYRQRDRVGLIALQGGLANLLFHPVTNLAVIASGMDKLTGGGGTALADGLMKATDTLQMEKRRNLGSVCCVVLISDGLTTEPLSRSIETKTEGLSELKSQEDVISVSQILAKRRMPVITLNPLHIDDWKEKDMISPTNLLRAVSHITGGSYFGFKSGFFKTEMNEQSMVDAVERGLSGIRL